MSINLIDMMRESVTFYLNEYWALAPAIGLSSTSVSATIHTVTTAIRTIVFKFLTRPHTHTERQKEREGNRRIQAKYVYRK